MTFLTSHSRHSLAFPKFLLEWLEYSQDGHLPLDQAPQAVFYHMQRRIVELPPAEGSSALRDNFEAPGAEAPSLIGQSPLPCGVLVSLREQQEKGRQVSPCLLL